MHESEGGREDILQTVLDDGMGLAPANFHECPRTGHGPLDLLGDRQDPSGLPKFIKVFQNAPPSHRTFPTNHPNPKHLTTMDTMGIFYSTKY
jgi:hypothetical protein